MSSEHNTVRKIFLKACFCWDVRFSLSEIDQKFKFGGTIRYGYYHLESIFCNSKVFTLHAKLHDAAAALRPHGGNYLGYCYMIGRGPNSFLLGHLTGLFFSLYLKVLLPSIFKFADF